MLGKESHDGHEFVTPEGSPVVAVKSRVMGRRKRRTRCQCPMRLTSVWSSMSSSVFFLSSLMHPALDRKDMRQCGIQEDLKSEGKRHVIEGNECRQWWEWVTKDPRWVFVGFFFFEHD